MLFPLPPTSDPRFAQYFLTAKPHSRITSSPIILKLLRNDTSARHAALEQRLPLVDPQLTRDCYREILERYYGYHLPLEARLMAVPVWEETGFDFAERCKVPRLEKDLGALGKPAEERARLPRCGVAGTRFDPSPARVPLRHRRCDARRAGDHAAFAGESWDHAGDGRSVLCGLWRTSVGSANFDNRSFRLNDEANLNILGADIAEAETHAFDADLQRAREVTYADWLARPAWQRATDGAAALFRSQL